MVGTRNIEIWQGLSPPLSLLDDQPESLCGRDIACVTPTTQDYEGIVQIRKAKLSEEAIVGEGGKTSLLQQLSISEVGILLGRHRGAFLEHVQVLVHHYRPGILEVEALVLNFHALSCNLVKSHDDILPFAAMVGE